MIGFANAKINIGLDIVRRRSDGYHDLQTVFYPVGKYAGTPVNPDGFCDVLECVPAPEGETGISLEISGLEVDCSPESNLVYKAARMLLDRHGCGGGVELYLDKHIPFGAGMGGGSSDAVAALQLVDAVVGLDTPEEELLSLARRLGADCPFFLYNKPMYAEGTGDRLEPVSLDLSGRWLVVAMPWERVSTKEAFSAVTPSPSDFDLRRLPEIPVELWHGLVKNDFEESLFSIYPKWRGIKQRLYEGGAVYASLTGSGSAFYGICNSLEEAEECRDAVAELSTVERTYLLSL